MFKDWASSLLCLCWCRGTFLLVFTLEWTQRLDLICCRITFYKLRFKLKIPNRSNLKATSIDFFSVVVHWKWPCCVKKAGPCVSEQGSASFETGTGVTFINPIWQTDRKSRQNLKRKKEKCQQFPPAQEEQGEARLWHKELQWLGGGDHIRMTSSTPWTTPPLPAVELYFG